MKKIFLFFALSASTLLFSAAKEELKEYPFVRQVKQTGKSGYAAAITFDKKLYQNTNEDYSNILLLDKNGQKVPYAVRDAREIKKLHSWKKIPGEITGFSRDLKANTATVDFSFTKPAKVSRLVLPSTAKRFNKKVTVIFFDKTGKETGRKQNLPLYQYGNVFGNANVDFPEMEADKIRVMIHNFAERKESAFKKEISGKNGTEIQKNIRDEEYDLKGVTAYRKIFINSPDAPLEIPVELPEISRQNKERFTEITVDAHRVPCTELSVRADDTQFSREVSVYSVTEKKESLLKIFRLNPDSKEVRLPEIRGERYIIRIQNGDNEPLKNIRLQWKVKDKMIVLIPPENGGDLKLYYGGRGRKQVYDIEKYLNASERFSKVYQLEEEMKSPDYAPELQKDDIFKYLAWVILAAAAVLLLIIILKMLNNNPCGDVNKPGEN
ncbi:MAG: hypothetical protein IKB25_02225 [Lentisphaeria bacterium]|nr:hypothetical protein [Lentisphaeria bacterium]